MFNRLYLSHAINTFGSWLTFLAIALVVQENHGSHYVAVVFLIQTLPGIFLSRGLANLIPSHRQEQVFIGLQIMLALNVLVLVFNQSLPVVFAHLFIASVIRSVSMPLFNTLIGQWVPSSDQQSVFTRLGALQAGMLAFAPMAGAWIKVVSSANVLFLLDAVTFILSLALLKELFITKPELKKEQTTNPFQWRSLIAQTASKPNNLSRETHRTLLAWFSFLAVGALLNAIEFPGFEIHGLSQTEIGYALGAWGVGNLWAFFLPSSMSPHVSAALYVGSLAVFVFAVHPIMAIASFLLMGVTSSYFSGYVRARLQKSVTDRSQSIQMWAYATQITQVINLISYGMAGLFLTSAGFLSFGAIALVTGLILVVAAWHSVRAVATGSQEVQI